MASLSDHCTHCNRGDRDRAGAIRHEAWCPMFLRGPDAGGDPHEWPTLLNEAKKAEQRDNVGGATREAQHRAAKRHADNRSEER